MGITIPTAGRNAMVNALVDLIDAGSANTTGELILYTSGDVAVATLAWTATPAFGDGAVGVATMNTINDDTNAVGGDLTGGYHAFEDRDNTEVFRGNVGTAASDLNLSSLNIGATDTVSVSSYTVTQPAS